MFILVDSDKGSSASKISASVTANVINKMVEIDEYNFRSSFKDYIEYQQIKDNINQVIGNWFS